MREIFNHATVPSGKKHPYVVTTCTIVTDELVVRARGVSICSCLDQYNRKKGNAIARGRAWKAQETESNFHPIQGKLKEISGYNWLGESWPESEVAYVPA